MFAYIYPHLCVWGGGVRARTHSHLHKMTMYVYRFLEETNMIWKIYCMQTKSNNLVPEMNGKAPKF